MIAVLAGALAGAVVGALITGLVLVGVSLRVLRGLPDQAEL